jgi:hypothetical protein
MPRHFPLGRNAFQNRRHISHSPAMINDWAKDMNGGDCHIQGSDPASRGGRIHTSGIGRNQIDFA